MEASQIKNITTRIERHIATMSDTLGLELRFGYVGNTGRHGDDRSWHVWIQGINVPSGNTLSALSMGVPTDDLFYLLGYLHGGGITKAIKTAKDRGYRFVEVKNWNLEVTQTAEEVEAAVNAIA